MPSINSYLALPKLINGKKLTLTVRAQMFPACGFTRHCPAKLFNKLLVGLASC